MLSRVPPIIALMEEHNNTQSKTQHLEKLLQFVPFGMAMPDRQTNSGNYRYGYNGMELDNEVSGNGNSYTTEFRQYDPRLGRWKSLDQLRII